MLCSEAYESLAHTPPDEKPTHSTPPSIDAIRAMSELTVTQVELTDVVSTSVHGQTGRITVDMLIRGTVTLGVDLEQARFIEVDKAQQNIVLALPPPEVRRVAIDHEASRVLNSQRGGLWRMTIGDALEDQAIRSALVIGQQRLSVATSRHDLNQRAGGHAEAVLGRFISEMGWTLDVRWQK
jgi:hypothetical protein